ncbi:MAG: VCBS repeat-containing protein [Chitinophagaceae bacterium]|nr:VCBS repeat-containing protein [Chitinophagaceae bacterium]
MTSQPKAYCHRWYGTAALVWVLFYAMGCSQKQATQAYPPFEVMEAGHTQLLFKNTLRPDSVLNMFKYMYFYNGAGVGAADFNGDGLTDLFFAGNQVANRLYLNKGNFTFEDITQKAGIPNDGGWSTGVSVVDINQDGLMDIYVCRVGNFENLRSHNQLLLCTGIGGEGIPQYREASAEYGLNFSGFSTQAVFFDYDLDNDLDLFLMNHAVHHSGKFAARNTFNQTTDSLSGDRFFRNDKGKYINITATAGIYSNGIGYGLGAVVTDVNLDGYPDLYIGNDFHENDYLYINQKNGTFADEAARQLNHTSQFSMGVDAGDLNNDGWPEIVSLDMLPNDPYILKRSLGEDAYDIFNMKIKYGYQYQYARNNLQLNLRNGHFAETGLYSGIYATDWSWSALFIDFDLDGHKDLFIGNGIPKRLNDMDYVQFVTNEAYQQKIRTNSLGQKDLELINRFPEIKLPNHFYRNKGNAVFDDLGATLPNNPATYSNGAAYADLDNDGDLDIVVNNIEDHPLIYKNNMGRQTGNKAIRLQLKGPQGNLNASGARLIAFCGSNTLVAEYQPVRGFQSSMQVPLVLGIGQAVPDSVWLIWPNNRLQRLPANLPDSLLTINYSDTLPAASLANLQLKAGAAIVSITDQTDGLQVDYVHRENEFNEFNREPLLPRMLSTEGPALATADVNGDGLTDFFIGGARDAAGALYQQTPQGGFTRTAQPALQADSAYEDTDARFADLDGDGRLELVVVSGGNEFYGGHPLQLPRLYRLGQQNRLQPVPNGFAALKSDVTWGKAAVADFNRDGKPDIFLAARCVPFKYGAPPASVMLYNQGGLSFLPANGPEASTWQQAGMVTDVHALDWDKNGWTDLLMCTEWGSINLYLNKNGRFSRTEISPDRGLWYALLPFDYNGDGLTDIVAANNGLNSRLKASAEKPVRLYFNDFDGNGRTEQLLTYYPGSSEIPFANKDELQKQLPGLKKQYLYAEDFAKANLKDLVPANSLSKAVKYEVNNLAHMVYLNNGKGGFVPRQLPDQTQWTLIKTLAAGDVNADGLPDLMLGGNFRENNIQMGRNDAAPVTLLINRGKGNYQAQIQWPGGQTCQVRGIMPIQTAKNKLWLLALNNDRVRLISF